MQNTDTKVAACRPTVLDVTVVIPVYNEERHIRACVESVVRQDFSKDNWEVLFVDGGSGDQTRAILQAYTEQFSYMALLDNPRRTVPYAMNIGVRAARGRYLIRLDAHTTYAYDYVSACVYYLEKTGADNVGGPTVVTGEGPRQSAIAAGYVSPFALGGGKQHNIAYEGFVDTVSFGAFRKESLLRAGLYDGYFTRNQDDELNYRIQKMGGRIYQTPDIRFCYTPRASFTALGRQYFQYGAWKVPLIRKHKKPARLTHLIPVLFVLFLALGGLACLFSDQAAVCYCALLGLYAGLVVCFSFGSSHAKGMVTKTLLCWVHVVLHVSYGAGFFAGLFTHRYPNRPLQAWDP